MDVMNITSVLLFLSQRTFILIFDKNAYVLGVNELLVVTVFGNGVSQNLTKNMLQSQRKYTERYHM
jgi:hypothetical protein